MSLIKKIKFYQPFQYWRYCTAWIPMEHPLCIIYIFIIICYYKLYFFNKCWQTEEFEQHISTYAMIGVSYTKSIFPDIRANAAIFVGKQFSTVKFS